MRSSNPEFFSNPSEDDAILPTELKNEPFCYDDNGYRPNIIKARPRFLFQIDARGEASCKIEQNIIAHSANMGLGCVLPEKSESNISIISVYDTYGLNVVYTYLKYLYYHKSEGNHSSWLEVYLEGSLLVLRPTFKIAEDIHILYLSSLLMLDIMALDRRNHNISDVQIPSREGRIFDRVLLLSTGEYYIIRTNAGKIYETELRRDGSKFVFSHNARRGIRHDAFSAKIIEYSLGDYEQVYLNRGSESLTSMIGMLEDLKARIPSMMAEELSSWLLLTIHIPEDHYVRTVSFEDLKKALEYSLNSIIKTKKELL